VGETQEEPGIGSGVHALRRGMAAPAQAAANATCVHPQAAARQLSGGFADHTPQRGNQDPPQAAVRM